MVWLFFCRHSELRSPYLPVILRPFGTIVVRLAVLKKRRINYTVFIIIGVI